MITFRVTADVKDDRRVALTPPPDVPTGPTELEVIVAPPAPPKKRLRTSLADRAEANAESWGSR